MERVSYVSYKAMWLSDNRSLFPDPVGSLILMSPTTLFVVVTGEDVNDVSSYRIVRFERETILEVWPASPSQLELHLTDGGVVTLHGVANVNAGVLEILINSVNAASAQLSKPFFRKIGMRQNDRLQVDGFLDVFNDWDRPELGCTGCAVLALEFGYLNRKIYLPRTDGIVKPPRISCTLVGTVERTDRNATSGSVVPWTPLMDSVGSQPIQHFGGYFTNNPVSDSLLKQRPPGGSPSLVSGIITTPDNDEFVVFSSPASGSDITSPRGEVASDYQGSLGYHISASGQFFSTPDQQSIEATGEVGFDRLIVIYTLPRSTRGVEYPSNLRHDVSFRDRKSVV